MSRALSERLIGIAGAGAYVRVDPPVLQPADVFLDLSGEDIRRRLFLLDDTGGERLCLRPDLTIPTALAYLGDADRAGLPARFAYAGKVFRQQLAGSTRPREIAQVGFECFGEVDAASADVEILGLAVEGVRAGGVADARLDLGDLGLLHGVIDGLDMPERWRAALKRTFWQGGKFRALLDRLADGDTAPNAADRRAFLAALSRLDRDAAQSMIEGVLELAGIPQTGGRTPGEIARRFLDQAADATAEPLDARARATIEAVLEVDGAPRPALDRVLEIARGAALSIDAAADAFTRRLDRMEAAGLDTASMRFSADFGRRLEYYTGFMFEVVAVRGGEDVALAGGGRYDRLLRELGAEVETPAVGCAIRIDDLARLGQGDWA
ncbi:ATP phosphoribosyltransferase regulatory subunit [Futiania mangrovi]|uniref:Histidine--tRNA ligase n=1 Tax=Futiania mangrovi TaxID=2959716 RepID=A0A9J6PGP4_9PROT|nr:ATP phosphoribosyltransferase regulatory subunit [Futiania mangrovii]MCP1337654.1 ATP phosphoribosyltransferase regulatory subunit [Futiania mangrovii]